MSKQFKVSAFITLILAVLFYLFFQVSKHDPALSQVNAFADDPYDAIGSFGVQFALFAALLALVRAFRPYQSGHALDNQQLLFLRAEYLSCLSVLVTMVANIIAMVRHPSVWLGLSAGYMLALLTGGMIVITILVIWFIHHTTRYICPPSISNVWTRAIGISIVGILVLALYPEGLRQSTPGEFFTVLVGAALLFVPLWALSVAISPFPAMFFEDVIDDIAALYRWLKTHIGPLGVLGTFFECILTRTFVRYVLRWLNPRQYIWKLPLCIGIVMGILLALGEAFGEGGGVHQIGRFAIIAAVYISLEGAAVLLGYLLLAKPMGLFRQTSAGKIDANYSDPAVS